MALQILNSASALGEARLDQTINTSASHHDEKHWPTQSVRNRRIESQSQQSGRKISTNEAVEKCRESLNDSTAARMNKLNKSVQRHDAKQSSERPIRKLRMAAAEMR